MLGSCRLQPLGGPCPNTTLTPRWPRVNSSPSPEFPADCQNGSLLGGGSSSVARRLPAQQCPRHRRGNLSQVPHLAHLMSVPTFPVPGSPFPVPAFGLPGERPHILSDPRKGFWGIPTIPTGYTLGYTRRWRKPSKRPLGVSNPYQKGSKRRQKLAKRRLPILTFGRKTALALAPRPIHPLGGYQKWGISPNRVYYSERDTKRYYSKGGNRELGTGKGQTTSRRAGRPAKGMGRGSPRPMWVLSHSVTRLYASGDTNSSRQVSRLARRRSRMAECIWLTRDSERSRVAPISFIVISS
jgi:hypothetical protein